MATNAEHFSESNDLYLINQEVSNLKKEVLKNKKKVSNTEYRDKETILREYSMVENKLKKVSSKLFDLQFEKQKLIKEKAKIPLMWLSHEVMMNRIYKVENRISWIEQNIKELSLSKDALEHRLAGLKLELWVYFNNK